MTMLHFAILALALSILGLALMIRGNVLRRRGMRLARRWAHPSTQLQRDPRGLIAQTLRAANMRVRGERLFGAGRITCGLGLSIALVVIAMWIIP